MVEARRKEKREFFRSIDWTQPEKVTQEEIAEKIPEQYYLNNYLQQAISPAIVLFGFIVSQPFQVIVAHVINARYLNTNGGRYT